MAFKSGYLYDMREVTRRAHAVGALVIWDLCHSAGALPIDLDDCKADMAIGCTYKYLNGGPGSPAFLYVHGALQDRLRQPIWGWFGQQQPFAFDLRYAPAAGIQQYMAGTPNILSLAAVEPAVDMLLRAGMERVREHYHRHSRCPGGCRSSTINSPRAVSRSAHLTTPTAAARTFRFAIPKRIGSTAR